ncbi:CDC123 [Bugula neritina]|uniref:CDC123 n=1 Tax=Bugula neritina TaxID=10212 RepID=A0A7J7J9M4_BUGNE|nr:CDC123 [Bugula neritina]
MGTNQEILNCSFNLWYPNFRTSTIPSIVIKVPKVFTDYLLEDGLFLPDNFKENQNVEESWSTTTVDANPNDDGISNEERKSQAMFANKDFIQFRSDVLTAISKLGGKVFPKLNWSSPKDASWIAVNNSLCCETFNDICLLFKSSDFITHDLTEPFISVTDQNLSSIPEVEYVLVLRRWLNISPSGEFRCFVKDKKLIAISQRSQHFHDFIDPSKSTIVQNICHFFENRIVQVFPESSYTFDVSMPRLDKDPTLLDFNPFQRVTDGLLFSWDELNGETEFPERLSEDGSRFNGIVFRSVPKEGMLFQ